MKQTKTRITLIIISIISFSLLTIVYAQTQIDKLNDKLVAKQNDKEKIDEFILVDHQQPVVIQKTLDTLKVDHDNDEGIKYIYQTPEGIQMISYSSKWNTDKLQRLYDELKLNKHGEEFSLLKEVVIYPDSTEYAAGDQSTMLKKVTLDFKLPALASNSSLNFFLYMGSIRLYNGDQYTRIQDMAHVLSHEYGHHFTFYHFFKNDIINNSEYETIRNFGDSEIYYNWNNSSHYMENHHWYLIEIAADDYVQLMGSPLTKNVSRYTDVKQNLTTTYAPPQWRSYNGTIQGNLLLPFADEVKGLKEYYYSFITEKLESKIIPLKIDFDLKITKKYSEHQSQSGPLTFERYEISWDDVYKDQDAIYTLVCSDEDGSNMIPIKTVYPNQATNATIGTVSYEDDSMIYWRYDEIDQGTKIFVVTVLLPDYTLYKSQPLTYAFR